MGFLNRVEPGAFGFLDPKIGICTVNLVPAFAHGRRKDLSVPL